MAERVRQAAWPGAPFFCVVEDQILDKAGLGAYNFLKSKFEKAFVFQ